MTLPANPPGGERFHGRALARERQHREVLAALEAITERYVELAGSGDCGFWNPEEETVVKQARAAILRATARTKE